MLQSIGIWQIALILVIVLLLFGVGKLPQIGRGMGQAINEFKDSLGGMGEEPTTDIANDESKK